MDFANGQVASTELPQYSLVTYTPLSKRFVRIRLGVLMAFYLIFGLAVFSVIVVRSQIPAETAPFASGFLLVASLVAALLMALLAWFVYASTRAIHYAIRDHDIILKSGVFWKKEVIQPLKRVQHVELTRGPIDKRFGLANVRLFSAGTGQSTFRIPGIELQLASRIKQYVLDYQEADTAEQAAVAVIDSGTGE